MFDTAIALPCSPSNFPMFFDEPKPQKLPYKVYHDGSHYVATICGIKANKYAGGGKREKQAL